uniref:Putative secreted protein n=1 Tax=Anopheles marajoara TaxID=58244 RepID=A0A2M4C886_9DIPT
MKRLLTAVAAAAAGDCLSGRTASAGCRAWPKGWKFAKPTQHTNDDTLARDKKEKTGDGRAGGWSRRVPWRRSDGADSPVRRYYPEIQYSAVTHRVITKHTHTIFL